MKTRHKKTQISKTITKNSHTIKLKIKHNENMKTKQTQNTKQ